MRTHVFGHRCGRLVSVLAGLVLALATTATFAQEPGQPLPPKADPSPQRPNDPLPPKADPSPTPLREPLPPKADPDRALYPQPKVDINLKLRKKPVSPRAVPAGSLVEVPLPKVPARLTSAQLLAGLRAATVNGRRLEGGNVVDLRSAGWLKERDIDELARALGRDAPARDEAIRLTRQLRERGLLDTTEAVIGAANGKVYVYRTQTPPR